MVVAALARVHDEAEQVALDYRLNVTLTATYNLDIVALELVLCTLAHVACEHYFDAHLLHYRGDVGLTSAAFGRVEARGGNDVLIFDVEDGIVGAVAEVIVDVAITRRNSYLHTVN